MDKKKLPKTKQVGAYLPARLVKAKDRWYISFYQTDPDTGQYQKHRITGDINRIKDSKLRTRRAKELIDYINTHLPAGYPYTQPETKTPKQATTLKDAINIAIDIKMQGARLRTRQAYQTIQKKLITWAQQYTITISELSTHHALDFMDSLSTKHAPTTYNNHLILCKSIFATLVDRKYLDANPFTNISKKKETPKTRRAFTDQEKKIVAAYIKENHYWLYLGLLLEYYGHIRPVEIRRLQLQDIDPVNDLVHLPAEKTKSGKERHVTLPTGTLAPYLHEFQKYPPYYLLFGRLWKPGTLHMGHNAMNRAHTQVLRKLQKQNLIQDIQGLTWYSWKDTGISDLAKILPLPEVQAQAGHSNPATTLIYYQRHRVRSGYKNLKLDL